MQVDATFADGATTAGEQRVWQHEPEGAQLAEGLSHPQRGTDGVLCGGERDGATRGRLSFHVSIGARAARALGCGQERSGGG